MAEGLLDFLQPAPLDRVAALAHDSVEGGSQPLTESCSCRGQTTTFTPSM